MKTICDLAAHELAARIRMRALSCREVMQAFLARIDAVNGEVNAIVSRRDSDVLLAEADACDAHMARRSERDTPRSFLFGLPQAIKDVALTAGLTTTFGSPLLRDNVPASDGLMAARMKAAGCIVVGKTNTPEFGLGSHTFNEVFGATRNAFDRSKSAGGSSGGAAAALATHMLPVADGSDSMGSLRNPAAWGNVFGFRPSQGRVPQLPAQDVWVTHFGTEGPMARNVLDLALLLDVQAGYDPRAPLSLATEPSFADRLEAPSGAAMPRIGWLGDLGRPSGDGGRHRRHLRIGLATPRRNRFAPSSRWRSAFRRSGCGAPGSPGAHGSCTAASRRFSPSPRTARSSSRKRSGNTTRAPRSLRRRCFRAIIMATPLTVCLLRKLFVRLARWSAGTAC